MPSLRYIKHKDINFEKWNNAILSSKIPFVFAQSYYLNATSPNWDALVMGDYDSVFPLPIKQKFGYTYLAQPPFTSQLGAFGKFDMPVELQFFNYISSHYKLIDLELNAYNQLDNTDLVSKKTFILAYDKEIVVNQNTKRNISKAQSNGLTVLQVFGKDIISLSQKHISPFLVQNVNLNVKTVALLDQLLLNADSENQLTTFKVVDANGNIKALAHFISNGIHSLYLKGVTLDKQKNSGSMHLLIQHAIDYFSTRSILFDFGGGSAEGLGKFYAGFGGEEMYYKFLQLNRLPKFIKVLKNKISR